MEKIIPEIDTKLLLKDLNELSATNLITSRGDFDVYIAKSNEIPNILLEIGRLRELTFRQNGEGTGLKLDIDRFDGYYLNLFVWDKQHLKIVSGYRMGLGDKIMASFGKEGFYSSTLFNYDLRFQNRLNRTVELGRSFVIKGYQKKLLPFFLLWRAISIFLTQHPLYLYLLGPISISRLYSDDSKSLIVAFLKNNYFNPELSELVKPKDVFNPSISDKVCAELLEKNFVTKFKDLEVLLQTSRAKHFRVPVLLKQYTKLNGTFIGFNIDPNFSDVLDGLMILDVNSIPNEVMTLLNDKKS